MAKFRSKNRPLRVFKPQQRSVTSGQHLLSVDSLADDGRGIARVNGKTVFVAGALAGEKINARYVSSHKTHDDAVVVSTVETSAHRVKPACEYFGQCGGCDLQHLDYPSQTEHKQRRLSQLFSAWVEGNDKLTVGSITSNPWSYRHRARFSVDVGKNSCNIGFRQARSHKVIDVTHCHIVADGINSALSNVRALITSLKNRSVITEVSITEDSVGKMGIAIFCTRPLSDRDISVVNNYSVTHQCYIEVRSSNTAIQCVFPDDGSVSLSYKLDAYDLVIPYTVDDFTQVNSTINYQLIALAVKWLALDKDDVVADFFCGIGNFSLPVSKFASRVVGFELIASMVAKARDNAALNSIDNCQFKVIDLTADKLSIDDEFSKALLDPPRAGAEKMCRQLAASQLQRIVYISCNPRTLARDTKILTQGNYRLTELSLADMFPQTAHSEVVALFTHSDQPVLDIK
ncbi:MAG: 23S rRNA (uracil(1939)-C(5))-methyltransferase RlmD [Oceanicoccus sp.]